EYERHDLITSCPQVVLGKYTAVTSFDSGSLVPNEDEILAGWQGRGGIAYSPKVESVEKLPHDLYDEWYVLDIPRDLGNRYRGECLRDLDGGWPSSGLCQLRARVR